jgi:DNA-binding CsgD family transcriptional regulator
MSALHHDTSAVAALTDGQVDCLRLVKDNFTSKEIARRLGISRHTVDQRLRMATRSLAAASRYEAARIAFGEADQAYQSIAYQLPHFDEDVSAPIEGGPSGYGNGREGADVLELCDAPSVFRVASTAQSQHWPYPIPDGEKFPVGTSIAAKVALVFIIAALSLLAFGATVSGLEFLSRLT